MLNQKDLNQISKGENIDHFLLIRKCETRLTKSNKPYLFLELGDKSASVVANMWDNFENLADRINAGDVIKITGTMDEYQGTAQIKIISARMPKASENISASDFLPKSKRDIKVMEKEFFERLEKISDIYLKTLVSNIFTEENFGRFSAAPAGKSWHHSYIHGLLEHTLEIIRICDLMCDIHPEINRDLLICGAMLHDFGKTQELSFDSAFEYTDRGKLLGHIVISAMLVDEESKKIDGFPPLLRDCLIHLILSHQGKLEYASPVIPKTLEAITLYQADELSAKTNAYKNALLSGSGGENKWTRYISLASTDLFNHGLTPEIQDDINNSLFD